MSGQLAFDLPHLPTLSRDAFFVAPCNRDAAAWIDRWPDWPGGVLLLLGPAGCGKSHLAAAWRLRAGAEIFDPATNASEAALAPGAPLLVEDAEHGAGEPAVERRLFHLVNAAREAGKTLLLTARRPPAEWPLRLPDLASRLRACPQVRIAPPDDDLLAAVLSKQFSDRQLRVEPRVIGYLALRMERSFAAAVRLVDDLDRLALSQARAITLPLAKRVLADYIEGDGEAATDRSDPAHGRE